MRALGFTLLETLVVLSIFSLLTGLIAVVFAVSHRYHRLYQRISSAQREASLGLRLAGQELQWAKAESLLPSSSCVNTCWFLSCRPPQDSPARYQFSDDGEQLWQKWVGLGCSPQGQLRRYELPLSSPKIWEAFDLGSAPSSLLPLQSRPSKLLASWISRLTIRRDQRLMTIEIVAETQLSPLTEFRLHSSFSAQ